MNTLPKLIAGISTGILFLCLSLYGIGGLTHVEPGEVAVKIKNFGDNKGMQEDTLGTGTHWVDPITMDIANYDSRRKQYDLPDVPSSTMDGQKIVVDLSVEVGLVPSKIPNLHEQVGPHYFDQVVWPAIRSELRDATSTQMSDAIYTGDGRAAIQELLHKKLETRFSQYGIDVAPNLRAIKFQNKDFVQTLETKAKRSQEVVIAEREAEAAAKTAIKTKNEAEGAKFARIQAAEADREERKLMGEGQRLQDEEKAKGMLAIAQAEAEGKRLMNEALRGSGGKNIVALEWARQLGPNVKVLGYPLGAPGTTGLFAPDGVLGSALKVGAAGAVVNE